MKIDSTLLKNLVPIKQLQNEHQRLIAEKSQIIKLHAGDELSANEEHQWFIYLVDGKLDLLEIDESPVLLTAADGRALHPVFIEGEYKTRLVAQMNCVVLRFDRQLFDALIDEELITVEVTENIEAQEIEGGLYNEILHDFNSGKLKLRSLPDIANKIKKALNVNNICELDLARVVSADPVIAIRLIRSANGNRAHIADPVCSIASAIKTLGLSASREIIDKMTGYSLFLSSSELLNQRMHELYDHSIDTAVLSYSVSRYSNKLIPEHLLFAGLVSEIGVNIILSYIESTGLAIESAVELEKIINDLRDTVGNMVIKHFGLSTDLYVVVNNFENWQRKNTEELDACDIVIVAQIYRRLRHHQVDGLPKINEVYALEKLGINTKDTDFVKKVFQKSHEEIVSIMQLLEM